MSAFIVSEDCINAIGSYLATNRGLLGLPVIRGIDDAGNEVVDTFDLSDRSEVSRLCQELIDMNADAVEARYGSEENDSTGVTEARRWAKTYVLKIGYASNGLRAFKSARCLRYQCAEGDVPETALYAWLDKLIGYIASNIVDAEFSDDLSDIPWG